MTGNSPKGVDRSGRRERRYRLSLGILVFSFAPILLSWSVFNWLSLRAVVGVLLPLLLIAAGLTWLLDRLLKSQGFSSFWPIETDWRGLLRLITLVAILTAAGPVYAYSHGIWMARSFISAFEIGISVESQELLLVEQGPKPDEPYRFRGVTTVYRLLGPVEEVDARIRERLVDKEGWRLSRTTYFWASCDRERVGRYLTMFLAQRESLHVAIHYGVPDYCLLE